MHDGTNYILQTPSPRGPTLFCSSQRYPVLSYSHLCRTQAFWAQISRFSQRPVCSCGGNMGHIALVLPPPILLGHFRAWRGGAWQGKRTRDGSSSSGLILLAPLLALAFPEQQNGQHSIFITTAASHGLTTVRKGEGIQRRRRGTDVVGKGGGKGKGSRQRLLPATTRPRPRQDQTLGWARGVRRVVLHLTVPELLLLSPNLTYGLRDCTAVPLALAHRLPDFSRIFYSYLRCHVSPSRLREEMKM